MPNEGRRDRQPTKREQLIADHRRRAQRDHAIAILSIVMMLSSIGGGIIVFVFAGQLAVNEMLSAQSRLFDSTSRFIDAEGPKLQRLLEQLRPTLDQLGANSERLVQPFTDLAESVKHTEPVFASLADAGAHWAEAGNRFAEFMPRFDDSLTHIARNVEKQLDWTQGQAPDAQLVGLLQELHADLLVLREGRYQEAGQEAYHFFQDATELARRWRIQIDANIDSLEANANAAKSFHTAMESSAKTLSSGTKLLDEISQAAGDPKRAVAPLATAMDNVARATWTTRAAASIVLAGLLYALSVIYRNSQVSARRNHDIVTALVLTSGRDTDDLDRIVQMLFRVADEPQLVDPSKAARGVPAPAERNAG